MTKTPLHFELVCITPNSEKIFFTQQGIKYLRFLIVHYGKKLCSIYEEQHGQLLTVWADDGPMRITEQGGILEGGGTVLLIDSVWIALLEGCVLTSGCQHTNPPP